MTTDEKIAAVQAAVRSGICGLLGEIVRSIDNGEIRNLREIRSCLIEFIDGIEQRRKDADGE